jgi:hypothetical protein
MLLATLTLLSVMIIPPTVIGTSKNSLYAFSAEKRVLPDFSFGAAADWACNFNTENTVSNIISKNPKLVLGIGDYYSDYYNESLGDGATTDAAHAGLE